MVLLRLDLRTWEWLRTRCVVSFRAILAIVGRFIRPLVIFHRRLHLFIDLQLRRWLNRLYRLNNHVNILLVIRSEIYRFLLLLCGRLLYFRLEIYFFLNFFGICLRVGGKSRCYRFIELDLLRICGL